MRLLALLLAALPAFAGITLDAVAASPFCYQCGTQSLPITIGNHANRVLIVFVGRFSNNVTITGATAVRGGVDTAMTQYNTTATQPGVQTFYLVAPDVGPNTVKWTQSNNAVNAQSQGIARSYYGVDQTTPIDKVVSAGPAATANPSAGSITPSGDSERVVDFAYTANTVSFINGGAWGNLVQNRTGDSTVSSDYGPISPASAQSNTYGSQNYTWIAVAIALNPVNACVITRSTLPDWNLGGVFSQTITTTGCSSPTFSIVGTLPFGLSISPSTGVISGTPTTPDGAPAVLNTAISFAVSVADASGSPTQALSLKIQRTWGFGQ